MVLIVTAKPQLHRQVINNMVLLVGVRVRVLGLLVHIMLLLLVLRVGVHVPMLLGTRLVGGTSLLLLLCVDSGVHMCLVLCVWVVCGRGAGRQWDLLLLRVVLRVGGGVRAVVVEVTVVSVQVLVVAVVLPRVVCSIVVLIHKPRVVCIQVVCIPSLVIVRRLPLMVCALVVVLVVIVVVGMGGLRRVGRGSTLCWGGYGWYRHRCCLLVYRMGVLVMYILLMYRSGRCVHGHGGSVNRRWGGDWGRDGSSRGGSACRGLLLLLVLRVCGREVVKEWIVLLGLGLEVLRVGVGVVGGFVDLDVGGVELVAQRVNLCVEFLLQLFPLSLHGHPRLLTLVVAGNLIGQVVLVRINQRMRRLKLFLVFLGLILGGRQ